MKKASALMMASALMVPAFVAGGSTVMAKTTRTSINTAKPKVINMLYANAQADSAALIAVLPQFEKKYGIKVNLTTMPYDSLEQKVFAEFSAHNPYYNIMISDTPWAPSLATQFQPLLPYIENPKMTNAKSFDISDFIPKVFLDTVVYDLKDPSLEPPPEKVITVNAIKKAGFNVIGLPIDANVATYEYRTSLFDNKTNQAKFYKEYHFKLQAPKTWTQFLDIARFFTDPKKHLWGTTLDPSVEAGALAEFKNFITAWGGHLFNGFPAPKENPKEPRWEPTFYSPQNVKAMTFVWDMVHKYKVTPPGVSNMNFDTSATAFDAGLTAMSYNYANLTLDKGVPGSIEYFVQPYNIINGKKYDSPHFGTWMIGINKYSHNKYWSWKLLEWLTSTPIQNEMLQEEIHPTRISAYKVALSDKALTKKFGNFYQVMYESLQIGLGRPRLEDYSAVSNIVHVMYNNIVSGKEPIVQALKQGDTQETALLQSLGYLPK